MRQIFSSIDIGSSAIKVVVCELFENKLNLLAASSVESKGIKKGLIVDANEAARAIKQAISNVEGMIGFKIKKVLTSVPGYYAEFTLIKGEVKVKDENGLITSDDIERVIGVAAASKLAQGKEIVTILPIDFRVDDKKGIANPRNLLGENLACRAILATAPKRNIYSVVGLLESMDIEVVDISLNCINDSYVFRNDEISEKIGAIINIGAETTTVSLYNRGIVVKSSIIGMGGAMIDNDLAYMYQIDKSEAKMVKEKYGSAHKKAVPMGETFEAKNTFGDTITINQLEAAEVVMARVEDILTLAKKEINILTNKELEYIIVTGGTSNLRDFDYLVNEVFDNKASVGHVKMIGLRNNKYASAVGNIVYFINTLNLKGKEYTMIDINNNDEDKVSKSDNATNEESMFGKVFGYFFGE